MKLASFDIFDTALIRKCGTPENVFFLLANELFGNSGEAGAMRNSFFLWRKQAEDRARRKSGNEYVTIADIYAEYDSISFPGVSAENAMQSEIMLESRLLAANSEVRELIDRKRSNGYRICFISDMYLDSMLLKSILIREKCASEEDEVFVSCEMKASKHEGSLYDIVRMKMNYPKQWEHYGDNLVSDIRRAANRGIRPGFIRTGYTEPENYFIESSRRYPFFSESSTLAGIQRAARLSAEKRQKGCGRDNATDFIAPVYISYVLYILKKAKETGITRLYFLSRDGYILYETAKIFKADFPDIELRYLYVSRYSLFLPSIYTLSKTELCESLGYDDNDDYPLSRQNMSVNRILHLLRTDKDILGNDFKDIVYFDSIRSREQEDLFFKGLSLPAVKNRILSQASKERHLLLEYFRQEKMLEKEIKFATVDIGWVGSSRLIINRILEHNGIARHIGFYLGCMEQMLPPKYGLCHCFYGYNLISACSAGLFEHYFSAAPHNSTIGYTSENNKIVPVLDSKYKKSQEEALIWENIFSVNAVAKAINDCGTGNFSETALKFWSGCYLDIISDMKCRVDYSPIAKLGKFNDTIYSYSLIRRISLKELIRFIRKGDIDGIILPRQSVCYSLGIRCGKHFRKRPETKYGKWQALKMEIRYRRKKLSGKYRKPKTS